METLSLNLKELAKMYHLQDFSAVPKLLVPTSYVRPVNK